VCAADEETDDAIARVVAALKQQHPAGVTLHGLVGPASEPRRRLQAALNRLPRGHIQATAQPQPPPVPNEPPRRLRQASLAPFPRRSTLDRAAALHLHTHPAITCPCPGPGDPRPRPPACPRQGGPALQQEQLQRVNEEGWFKETHLMEHVEKVPNFVASKIHKVRDRAARRAAAPPWSGRRARRRRKCGQHAAVGSLHFFSMRGFV
jgi:hypothetical protein